MNVSVSVIRWLFPSRETRTRRTCATAFTLAFFSLCTFGQIPSAIQQYRNERGGGLSDQRLGVLDGNQVRTIFFNTSEVAHWPDAMGGEWPKGSGHKYLDGLSVLIGAKVHLCGDTIITPIESHYREEFDYDPVLGSQYPWDLEPVPGYVGPQSTSPAMSSIPLSWPASWPAALNLSPDYNGEWFSYFGKGTQPTLTESFFVVDDAMDGEFTRAPYNYFPVQNDTTRGGLGLRLEVRSLQWNRPEFADMIFWVYRMTNISDFDYDTTCFGFFIDPGVGSYQNSTPANSMGVDPSRTMGYFWSEGGVGYPGNWKTGYLGLTFLGSPESKGLTAAKSWVMADKGPTGIWPRNDNVVWSVLNGGVDTATSMQNTNIAALLGTGPFALPKWSSDTLITALVFANDLPSLIAKKALAAELTRHNFQMPAKIADLSAFPVTVQSPVRGSTVSGTAAVSWETSGNLGRTVTYAFCQRQDEEWILIGVDSTNSGHVDWNTTTVRDGIFYGLRLVCIAENGSGFAETDSTFTVNNAGNALPEVILRTPEGAQPCSGPIVLKWMAGDADADPTFVSLAYTYAGLNGIWLPIAEKIASLAGSYAWDTHAAPNGSVVIRALPIAGADTGVASAVAVTIQNDRIVLPDERLNVAADVRWHGPIRRAHRGFHTSDRRSVCRSVCAPSFIRQPCVQRHQSAQRDARGKRCDGGRPRHGGPAL